MSKYVPVIGMEIHVELNTKSKMFCACPNGYELPLAPNTNICPVCSAQPGALPAINQQAVDWTILIGLALDCQIAKQSKFDRKNYFYPDLPKGYQISQYDQPLTFNGKLKIGRREIDIIRIHLEEDTGKLIHTSTGTDIDLSRAGTPLVELVSGPSIESAKEAKEFCQTYQQILRYLEVSEADMEKGQMRCEANISLQQAGKFVIENNEVKPLLDYELNPKVELKNINSFRALERAIDFEINRQTEALAKGGKLIQETRGWDDNKQCTFTQRIKETAADYRYFPEPDLPPLEISEELIASLAATLPELPQAKKDRFINQYQLNPESVEIIVADKNIAAYTEAVISELASLLSALPGIGSAEELWAKDGQKISKIVSNWLINRLFKYLNENKIAINDLKIPANRFAEFLSLVYQNQINNLTAQKILEEMFKGGQSAPAIMKKKNLGQMDDGEELTKIIKRIIKDNPKVVADFKSGKEAALKFLIGQVMAATGGQANPKLINEILKEKLIYPVK